MKNHPYAPHIQKLYEIGILYEKEGGTIPSRPCNY
ncbi:hypothetical protein ORM37_24275 [Bacillus cereus]|nr:hypothetical protein [Bacillus cereus]MDA2411292.1 hypothetical protein [Bacillus cereus]MDZ4422179.1 hypothetical protein [Bacillus cereus]MDZ4434882.1 hypothetical protein [Bacillus cereus]MDZ4613060.1 hypothetical protein [Bacillus cereus]UDV85386.1 hypothetical protein HQJ03_026665 [Bacillus cereus]